MSDEANRIGKASSDLTDALLKTLGDLKPQLLAKYGLDDEGLTFAIMGACLQMTALTALARTDASFEATKELESELKAAVVKAVRKFEDKEQ